jgi:hypothetical protein
LPVPHYPYIVNPDGRYRGAHPDAWNDADLAGYTRNLAYADKLLGEFVDAMRRADRFDDALIIVTSDHTWRRDPDRTGEVARDSITHVPLVVKLPGQRTAADVHGRFDHWRLGEVIKFALSRSGPAGELDRVFRRVIESPAGTTDARAGDAATVANARLPLRAPLPQSAFRIFPRFSINSVEADLAGL